MQRFVKIPSNKAGPFTAQNNRVEFDVGPNIDMSKSYVNYYLRVDTTDAVDTANPSVYKVQFNRSDGTNKILNNVEIVKNCNLRSENKGYLEDIRDIDLLKNNLYEYTRSTTQEDSKSFNRLGQRSSSVSGLKGSIVRELHKEGNVKSRELVAPVNIKLSELFSLGQMENMPESLGNLRIHTELNLDKLTVSSPPVVYDSSGTNADVVNNNIYLQMDNVNGIVRTFTTSRTLPLNYSPFYVGQKLQISADASGGAPEIDGSYCNIESITTLANGKIQITADRDIVDASGAGQLYENVGLVPVALASGNYSLTVEYAELIACVNKEPAKMDMLEYTTFTTEQFSTNLPSLQKIFQVEPEAVNLMVFKSNEPISKNTGNHVESYRVRVDNVDTTDRDVKVNETLYYDQINKTLTNAGLMVKNLNEVELRSSQVPMIDQRSVQNIFTIMTPLDMTEREKNVQININANGGNLERLNLYKQVVKVLQL